MTTPEPPCPHVNVTLGHQIRCLDCGRSLELDPRTGKYVTVEPIVPVNLLPKTGKDE